VSSSQCDEVCSLGFQGEFWVEQRYYCPCFDLGNGRFAEGVNRLLYFICRNSPLVVDTTTYWFGGSAYIASNRWSQVEDSSYTGSSWSGMTVSWVNRIIPAGSTDCVSLVIRCGPNPPSPRLTLQFDPAEVPALLDTSLTITASLNGSSGTEYQICAAVDRNLVRLVQIRSSIGVESPVSAVLTPAQLGSRGDFTRWTSMRLTMRVGSLPRLPAS
jgi:hypothetical protein